MGQELFLEHRIVRESATSSDPLSQLEVHLRALIEVARICSLAPKVDLDAVMVRLAHSIDDTHAITTRGVNEEGIGLVLIQLHVELRGDQRGVRDVHHP